MKFSMIYEQTMLMNENKIHEQNDETRLYMINKYNENKIKDFPVEYLEVELKEPIDIPNGIYDAIQGGYVIEIPSLKKTLKTTSGVKGHDIPIRLKIKDNKVEKMYYRATQDQMFEIEGIKA